MSDWDETALSTADMRPVETWRDTSLITHQSEYATRKHTDSHQHNVFTIINTVLDCKTSSSVRHNAFVHSPQHTTAIVGLREISTANLPAWIITRQCYEPGYLAMKLNLFNRLSWFVHMLWEWQCKNICKLLWTDAILQVLCDFWGYVQKLLGSSACSTQDWVDSSGETMQFYVLSVQLSQHLPTHFNVRFIRSLTVFIDGSLL